MTQKIKYKPDESGFLTQEDTKSYYSRVGMFCFLLGAVSFAISILVSMIIFKFFPWILDDEMALSIVDYAMSFLAIYCIATPIAFLAIKPLPKTRPIKEKMNLTHLLGAFCICFTAMQAGSYISSFLIAGVEAITGKTLTNPIESSLSIGNLLINALLIGIIFPILEELLFRKLLCGRLLALGEKKAIIISAVIFGLIHGNLFQFAYAFFIGLVFGYVYVKTGKIIYTMIFHCIINLFSGVFVHIVLSHISIEQLEALLDEIFSNPAVFNDPEALWALISPHLLGLILYAIYSNIMMILSTVGIITLFIVVINKKITFEQGILQTPKEHRFANFFLTGGVAAAIGYIALRFLYSIIS
jgi:membrane protease YdiL (CAAX protease family)